jgi:uncharacterized membrane protein
MKDVSRTPPVLGHNIDRVLRLEQHALERRSLSDKLSDAVGHFAGTLPFVAVHTVVFVGWLALNSGAFHLIAPFDPYPFNLLSTVVSCEAVIMTSFVLMKQNRESRLADRRDHLDLQVNLISEQESSLVIQMLDQISRKLEIPPQPGQEEALQLSRTATLERLVEQLHARFPDSDAELPPQ